MPFLELGQPADEKGIGAALLNMKQRRLGGGPLLPSLGDLSCLAWVATVERGGSKLRPPQSLPPATTVINSAAGGSGTEMTYEQFAGWG